MCSYQGRINCFWGLYALVAIFYSGVQLPTGYMQFLAWYVTVILVVIVHGYSI